MNSLRLITDAMLQQFCLSIVLHTLSRPSLLLRHLLNTSADFAFAYTVDWQFLAAVNG